MYNKIKILQHKEILKTIEVGKIETLAPVHVHLEVTEVCNFVCNFCAFHNPVKRADLPNFDFTGKRRLEFNRLLQLVDELAAAETQAIAFTGAGEQLLYPNLYKVLAKIRKNKIQFAVTSNLALPISDELIEELSHAQWIRWSLNAGQAETYQFLHNPKGNEPEKAFQLAQINARRLIAARQRNQTQLQLNASFVVSTDNKADIRQAAEIAQNAGVDGIAFRPDTSLERQEAQNAYVDETQQAISQTKNELETDQFKVHISETRLTDVMRFHDLKLICYYSNHTSYIAANGDVYPCCYTRSDVRYVIGNINQQDFRTLWASAHRQGFFKKLLLKKCPSCPYGETNEVLKYLYEGQKQADDLYVPAEKVDYFI